jgi:hypothetical protein
MSGTSYSTGCCLWKAVGTLRRAHSPSSFASLWTVSQVVLTRAISHSTPVTESLFPDSASNERKYWGFAIFKKALPRLKATDLPMLFTKNFLRTWINHLSRPDRYLHSFAKQIASGIIASAIPVRADW